MKKKLLFLTCLLSLAIFLGCSKKADSSFNQLISTQYAPPSSEMWSLLLDESANILPPALSEFTFPESKMVSGGFSNEINLALSFAFDINKLDIENHFSSVFKDLDYKDQNLSKQANALDQTLWDDMNGTPIIYGVSNDDKNSIVISTLSGKDENSSIVSLRYAAKSKQAQKLNFNTLEVLGINNITPIRFQFTNSRADCIANYTFSSKENYENFAAKLEKKLAALGYSFDDKVISDIDNNIKLYYNFEQPEYQIAIEAYVYNQAETNSSETSLYIKIAEK